MTKEMEVKKNSPTVAWDTAEFLVCVSTMTDEQTGRYAKLLAIQNQKGHLTHDEMLIISKTEDISIFGKFEKDDEGLYFNARMDRESKKSRAYSASRAENRWKTRVDEKIEDILIGVPPGVLEVEGPLPSVPAEIDPRFSIPKSPRIRAYCKKRNIDIDAKIFVAYYNLRGWKEGKDHTQIKNWMRTIEFWKECM